MLLTKPLGIYFGPAGVVELLRAGEVLLVGFS